jgi:hypothetical protein
MVFLTVLAACGGSGSDEPITVAFAKPLAGDAFIRDQLGSTGAVAAMVPVELALGGEPTRIALTVGPRALPDVDVASAAATAEVRATGMVTLTATAFEGDVEAATASVDISVGDITAANCRAWLDAFHIDYTVQGATPGVVDPISAKMPINGMPFKAVGATNPRTTLFADCRIIKSLVLAAPSFRERDIAQVTDYGVYNYRCIGTGTPPNCPQGMSQHAYAMAIDLAAFTTSDGTTYTVNDDWVIDPDSEKTCAAPTEAGKDDFLHKLICELKGLKIWNIVLTPNYNADHRNHFHVDLTPGSDFIERRLAD